MTVDRANQMITEGLPPGSSWEQVEAWLAAQGFPNGRPPGRSPERSPEFFPKRSPGVFTLGEVDEPYYEIHGWVGSEIVSAAKQVGLSAGQFYRTIHIIYEDAARPGRWRVTIYLFFDADNRLLEHCVTESDARIYSGLSLRYEHRG